MLENVKAELRPAIDRLKRLYSGEPYYTVYGCEQTMGGHQQRDERKVLDAVFDGSIYSAACEQLIGGYLQDFIESQKALTAAQAELERLRRVEKAQEASTNQAIERLVTGEGEPNKYASVTEMLANTTIKKLQARIAELLKVCELVDTALDCACDNASNPAAADLWCEMQSRAKEKLEAVLRPASRDGVEDLCPTVNVNSEGEG